MSPFTTLCGLECRLLFENLLMIGAPSFLLCDNTELPRGSYGYSESSCILIRMLNYKHILSFDTKLVREDHKNKAINVASQSTILVSKHNYIPNSSFTLDRMSAFDILLLTVDPMSRPYSCQSEWPKPPHNSRCYNCTTNSLPRGRHGYQISSLSPTTNHEPAKV